MYTPEIALFANFIELHVQYTPEIALFANSIELIHMHTCIYRM